MLMYASTVGWKFKAHQQIEINEAFAVAEQVPTPDFSGSKSPTLGSAGAAANAKAGAVPELKLAAAAPAPIVVPAPGSSLAAVTEHLARKKLLAPSAAAKAATEPVHGGAGAGGDRPPPLKQTPSIIATTANKTLQFQINSSLKSFVVYAADAADKASWLAALRGVITTRQIELGLLELPDGVEEPKVPELGADANAAGAPARSPSVGQVDGSDDAALAQMAFGLGPQKSTGPSKPLTAPTAVAAGTPTNATSPVAAAGSTLLPTGMTASGQLSAPTISAEKRTSRNAAAFTSTGGTLISPQVFADLTQRTTALADLKPDGAPATPGHARNNSGQVLADKQVKALRASIAMSRGAAVATGAAGPTPPGVLSKRGSLLMKPAAKPVMQPLSEATRCPLCDIKFGLLVRAHNCRKWYGMARQLASVLPTLTRVLHCL